MPRSPVKVTLLCRSSDLFTVTLHSQGRKLANTEIRVKGLVLKIISSCSQRFTHHRQLLIPSSLNVSFLIYHLLKANSPCLLHAKPLTLPFCLPQASFLPKNQLMVGAAKVPILHEQL